MAEVENPVCQCGKKQYGTRKSAKHVAKKAFPGQHLSAYPCGNGWHIGHLPSRVIAGDKDRSEIDRTPQPGTNNGTRPEMAKSNLRAIRKRRGAKGRPQIADDIDDFDEDYS